MPDEVGPASRTPEGDPLHCPLCGERFRLETSIETADATCPRCGLLVWAADASPAPREGSSAAARAPRDPSSDQRFEGVPAHLRSAFERLPESHRAAIRLRALEQRSWQEIAARTGLPNDRAARMTFLRAMAALSRERP